MVARAPLWVLVGPWLLAASTSLPAQQGAAPGTTGVLSMFVTSRDDGQALPFGTIAIRPPGVTRFTDGAGRLTFRGLAPGDYALGVREIGFAPKDTTVTIRADVETNVTVALGRVAIKLARITVRGRRSRDCTAPGIPEIAGDSDIDAVFRELRANIDRVRLLTDQYPLQYSLERLRLKRRPGEMDVVTGHDTVVFDDRSDSYRPGNVVYFEMDHGVRQQKARLITFADLADSTFQANHCFEYAGHPKVADQQMIQIDVRAARWLREPDVEGSIYLDANRYVVRRAVFHLSHGDRARPPIGEFGIVTTFREVAPLLTVFETVDTEEEVGFAERALEHDHLLSFLYVARSPGSQ